MADIGGWVGLVFVVALLMILNQKHRYSGKLRKLCGDLRELAEKYRLGQSEDKDLEQWERCLSQLEAHPNEYNRLDNEIGIRRSFAGYLDKHYPHDSRLDGLREAADWKKDSIWGIRIDRSRK